MKAHYPINEDYFLTKSKKNLIKMIFKRPIGMKYPNKDSKLYVI